MNARTITGAALLASTLLLGCGQAADPAPQVPAPSGGSDHAGSLDLPTPSSRSAESAVKARNSDSVGAEDSDATKDTALTRRERDEAMPLPGQANDHSSPEFAKRGDDKSSVERTN